jgi:serine phosphatase RsbU (regulator of sigma subunit)
LKNVFNRFVNRFTGWWQAIDRTALNTTRLLFLSGGWLLTFYFVIFSIEIGQLKWMQVWIVFQIYFLYQLNKQLVSNIKIPIDLLLIISLTVSSLQNSLLSNTLKTIPDNIILGFIPTFFLSLQILIFGLILVSNSSLWKRSDSQPVGNHSIPDFSKNIRVHQGSLIVYALIGYIAYYIVLFEHQYILYIFQFFLLLTLLNKTNWLERLSKPELITYFWLFLFIFYFYSDPGGLNSARFIESNQKITWFVFPFYCHLLIKMYLLAVIIKIPVVLIYNHATLSRKMWIAGLFQSSIPQLIQFIFLCFVFFALISSWQAENLRESLNRQVEKISDGKIYPSLIYKKIELQQGATPILISEYIPIQFYENDAHYGVIALTKTHKRAKKDFNKDDYFLFVKSPKSDPRFLYLVKLDTAFIALLTRDLSYLAGTGLIMYPYTMREWQKFIFDVQIFEQEDVTKIYPFGIFSLNDSWSILSKKSQVDSSESKVIILGSEDIFGNQEVILGRTFIPVNNTRFQNQLYFAVDIYIDFQSIFRPSTVGQFIWVLLLIFILFNSLVIRQVGKFGAQINKIILQKFSLLKVGIQQVAKGNLDYKFNMEGEDEFVELAGHFNEMSTKLKDTVAHAREKDRLDHELKIARQVQLSLLPAKLPEIKDYEIAASIKTANEIGGDFYDIVKAGKDKYLFTIGDVSGKGSSAAFYMAQFISLLRFSQQFTNKPDEIAIRMNKYFSTQIVDRQIFITAIIGVLDLVKNTAEIVRAGHTLPIFLPGKQDQKISEINLEGIGLGLTKTEGTFKRKIELKKINLNPGDIIVLYTDGVVEAAHEPAGGSSETEVEVYGEQRLMDLLNNSRNLNAADLISACDADLNLFYANKPRVDDHTLFFLQRKI